MTPRRLRVLIQNLPPESATMTALRIATPEEELERTSEDADPTQGRWSQLEQLVAAQLDVLRQQLHAFYVANSSGKGVKPQPPEPIPRPGVKRARKKLAEPTPAATETLFRLINGGAA